MTMRRFPALFAFSLLLVLGELSAVIEAENNSDETCSVGVDGTCESKDDDRDLAEKKTEAAPAELDEETLTANMEEINAIDIPKNADGYYILGYGDDQKVAENDSASYQRMKQMLFYMRTKVSKTPDYKDVRHCENQSENCIFWASLGECEANPKYMQIQCAPACLSCMQISFASRCPVSEEHMKEQIWEKGGLDAMFRRIVEEYGDDVTIMASPDAPLKTSKKEFAVPPWVITVDNVLTPEECDKLIELGGDIGYEKSKDVGAKQFDGSYGSSESSGRTSYNAWCNEACYEDPVTQGIIKKMEKLTGIPDRNAEYLQLLKYDVGQFYNEHHDYIVHHLDRAMGVRILTVFLYLNNVTEGGATYFNDLELKSESVQGRALLWPSVKNDEPNEKDLRLHHEAQPVIQGVKYGANAWYHQRDFKEPYARNCI